MPFLTSSLYRTMGVAIAGAILLMHTPAAEAADKVVVRYGIFRQSLSVEELTTFAEKGEMSRKVERYLDMAKSDPAEIRQVLTKPIDINYGTVNTALNNPLGNRMLDELGRMIQTPDNEGNRDALRTAVSQSAAKDNKVSILEIIQNYPSDEIHLDAKRIIKTYNTLAKYQKPIEGVLNNVEPIRELLKKQGINLPNFLK
ncbi:alpha/beta hydrolase [Phormidium sp. CLA17]|uniref:alpha/beta hydrolase n=1 Tax=Leptolyngbya sp. Cla-17 TaxID=2803751 RepID=UPI001491044C|nr:alpha/beta hydrolase [Leptolyngbya sp. Cla-17]MBM0740585.1 alpha/beta hydrolase [Leptolyngbya sp. Cla-17]